MHFFLVNFVPPLIRHKHPRSNRRIESLKRALTVEPCSWTMNCAYTQSAPVCKLITLRARKARQERRNLFSSEFVQAVNGTEKVPCDSGFYDSIAVCICTNEPMVQ